MSQAKRPVSRASSKDASSSSASSRLSSACLKAKAEQAALKAKVQALEVKHALDLEELKLKARRERHDVETELAAAEAKMHVFMGSVTSQATPEQPPSSLKQP